MPDYPKVNYIGNKEKIAPWICDHFPKDVTHIFDAFSGGCSLSYEAKKRGFQVSTNDVLAVNYHLARALIENNTTTLTPADLDIIFSGTPFPGFMSKTYANVFFFENECEQLDQYRRNIEKLDHPLKKSLAFSLMRRAMIRKMPYSRFTINWEKIKQLRDEDYSYEKYKRRRSYHNQSFEFHFRTNLDAYNQAIFDNKKPNKAYQEDIFNLLDKVEADLIYLDPPYTGTMNNYHGFYGLVDNYISGTEIPAFENNFMDKAKAIEIFERLFSQLGKFKYWALSYNNASYPTQQDLVTLLKKYGKKVDVVEKKHVYKITGKQKKETNKEYLFLVKN